MILTPGSRVPAAPRRPLRPQSLRRRRSVNTGVWDDHTLDVFADNLAEPARAHAAVQMYRVFNLKESLPIFRGR